LRGIFSLNLNALGHSMRQVVKIISPVALLGALALVLVLSRRSTNVVHEQPQAPAHVSTGRDFRPRVYAPEPETASGGAESCEKPAQTNLLAQIMDEGLQVTPEQIEPYLQKNRRSAESLLAAYLVTRDRALLREAMEKHADDPRACFLAYQLLAFWDREQSTPQERQAWLDAFKRAAPDNALPHYLAAAEYLESGQTELALQELLAAAGKPALTDYSIDYIYLREEAIRGAGYSEAEAKIVGAFGLLLPHLSQLKQLFVNAIELAKTYQAAGDVSGAQTLFHAVFNSGQLLENDTPLLITKMVGNAAQRMVLDAMDPNSPFGANGLTVQQQRESINMRRETLRELAKVLELLPNLPEQDLVVFFDRVKHFGDEPALRWLQNVYGQNLQQNEQQPPQSQ